MKGLSMGKFGMVTVNDTFVIMGLHHTTEKTKTIRSSAFSTDFFSAFCRNTLRHHYLKSLHICPVWKLCFFLCTPSLSLDRTYIRKTPDLANDNEAHMVEGAMGHFFPPPLREGWSHQLVTDRKHSPQTNVFSPPPVQTHTQPVTLSAPFDLTAIITLLCVL